jgi:glutamate-1-semialdehyde aminotransferase
MLGGVIATSDYAGPHVLYVGDARGARIWDVDSHEYADGRWRDDDVLHFRLRGDAPCSPTPRAYTSRKKIAKFEGGYHGIHDTVMMSVQYKPGEADPVEAPVATVESPGIPEEAVTNTLVEVLAAVSTSAAPIT